MPIVAARILPALLPVALLLVVAQAGSAQSADTAVREAWWHRISAGGDMRLRMETFQQDSAFDRFRGRVRLRVSAGARINKDFDVGVRLATGSPSELTSSNQTFGQWGSRKSVTLDRAFAVYHPSRIPALRVGAGKFAYPVRLTNMIWDENLSWEGAYEQLGTSRGGVDFKLTAVQSQMNEQRRAKDSYLYVESAEFRFATGRYRTGLTVSSLKFTNPDPLAVDIDNDVINGRSTNRLERNASGSVTGYASGFNQIDVVADVAAETGRKGYPLKATADFVRNLDASTEDDSGIWIEGQYGEAKALRSFMVGYTFARIEQEAALGAFVFDDMLGSNAVTHRPFVSYVPLANVNVDLGLIFSRWLKPRPEDNNNLLTRVQLSARALF